MSTSTGPRAGSTRSDSAVWLPFWKLVLIQAQNSFNEKGVQFLLIPLGVWLMMQGEGLGDLKYPLSAIIVLPFILFSPLAGWFSDRLPKARVIQMMAAVQVLVLGGMAWCLYGHNLEGALLWFCLFSIQATFFSPSKKGLVKDIVGTEHIGMASGILEMASLLALLVGQIGVFLWFNYLRGEGHDGWSAAFWPCLLFFLGTLPVAAMSLTLPRFRPLSREPFSSRLFYAHFSQLKLLWENKTLRVCETGIGYFWFLGGTVLLMTLQMAQAHTTGDEEFAWVGAILMAWLSGGSVLGGILASVICNGTIKMGVAAAGGIGMTLGCAALAGTPYGTPLFYVFLLLTGLFASGFLVPLNARLQDSADNDKRGDIIAAGNLIDCLMGLLAVGFQWAMMQLFAPPLQFATMAMLCALVTAYVMHNRHALSPRRR